MKAVLWLTATGSRACTWQRPPTRSKSEPTQVGLAMMWRDFNRPALNRPTTLAIASLILLPLIYFFPITLARGVWYTADLLQLYYPYALELSRALAAGHLPLWSAGVQTGFPLLAEGLVGALYPPNLFFYKLLPPAIALSQVMLAHLAWAGVGMYLCARVRAFSVSAAWLAAFVFSFGGVFLEQIVQPAILFALVWLPWLVFLQTRLLVARGRAVAIWFFVLTLAFGVQFVSGSVQMAFLNTVASFAFTFLSSAIDRTRLNPRQLIRSALWLAAPIALGGGLAAIQLIPTVELVGHSVRAGGLSYGVFVSYSLPREYLGQVLFPFPQGEPSSVTNEFHAYFGVAPFLLALLAPLLRRNRQTLFLFLFALIALSLAVGELNPLYQLLNQLPLFSFFRVPARYTVYAVFALSLLSATGFEELRRALSPSQPRVWLIVLAALFPFAALYLSYNQPLEFWMQVWAFLPFTLIVAAIILFAVARVQRIARAEWTTLILVLVVFDLFCYAATFLKTIDAIAPSDYLDSPPRSLAALESKTERVFTDISFIPSIPSIRGSLYPNTSLIYGRPSAQVYSSLAFARYGAYVSNLSPAMLNLLNARYVLLPLEMRVENNPPTPSENFALDVVNNEVMIPPTTAQAIEIVSFTDQSADLADGFVAGQVELRRADGSVEAFPLRLGFETVEWDYERLNAQHRRARVASSFPAFVRAYGRAFEGHAYLARFEFAARGVVGVSVRSFLPPARLIVEDARLVNADGRAISLAALTGKNDFRVAYWSDTVAVWRNENALPRAFIVHSAEVLDDAVAFARMRADGFRPEDVVLLNDGKPLAHERGDLDRVLIVRSENERVEIAVSTDRDGYLLLADSWYPGWTATVDGIAAEIYRADVLFRAVPISAGAHTVVFAYRPLSLIVGAVVSAVSLLVASAVAFWMRGRLQWHL